jgi:hypothetical protein
MGQPITVVEKPTTRSDVKRFELNRSLTGMGHEYYNTVDDAKGERPPDVLARRLFETGAVQSVHIYSNIVTVDLAPNHDGHGLLEAIEELFIHYLPGVKPTPV